MSLIRNTINDLKKNNLLNDLNFWILICFMVVWFFADSIVFRSDSMNYLNGAHKLLLDGNISALKSYPFRGPVFSLVSAFFLFISGNDPVYLALLPRLTGVAMIVVTFVFIRLYFDTITAYIVIGILIINPLFVEMAGTYHIDLFLSLVAILFFFILTVALNNNNIFLIIVSGFFFAIAFLTKELVVVMFPIPFITVLFSKTSFRLKYIFSFYFSFLLFIVPWVIYLLKNNHSILVLFGRHIQRESTGAEKKFNLVADRILQDKGTAIDLIFSGIKKFSVWYFDNVGFIVLSLIVLGVIISLWYIFKKREVLYINLLLAPLSFLVFAIYWGTTIISPRQLTTFVVFSIIISAPGIYYLKNIITNICIRLYTRLSVKPYNSSTI